MTPNTRVTAPNDQLETPRGENQLGVQNDDVRARAAVRFIIVEEHAAALDTETSPVGPQTTVLVRQLEGEPSMDLARRVAKQIASVERSGRRLGSAVIALAPCDDEGPKAARYLVACLLLAHAGLRRGPNELVLMVDGNAGIAVRHGVMGLVEALMSESGAAFIPIRARFFRHTFVGHSRPKNDGSPLCHGSAYAIRLRSAKRIQSGSAKRIHLGRTETVQDPGEDRPSGSTSDRGLDPLMDGADRGRRRSGHRRPGPT